MKFIDNFYQYTRQFHLFVVLATISMLLTIFLEKVYSFNDIYINTLNLFINPFSTIAHLLFGAILFLVIYLFISFITRGIHNKFYKMFFLLFSLIITFFLTTVIDSQLIAKCTHSGCMDQEIRGILFNSIGILVMLAYFTLVKIVYFFKVLLKP